MPRKISAAMVFSVFVAFLGRHLSAQSAASAAPLSGLTTIAIEIHITPADDRTTPTLARLLRNPVLLDGTIRDKVELEIRRSTNLRILPTAPTTLHVILSATNMNDNRGLPFAYFCKVHLLLTEPARIARNGVVVPDAISWQSLESDSWGSDDSVVLEMTEKLDVSLREFLNQYLTANPRP
jgi:hypothetical protein